MIDDLRELEVAFVYFLGFSIELQGSNLAVPHLLAIIGDMMKIMADVGIEKIVSTPIVAGNIRKAARGAGVRKVAEELLQGVVSVKSRRRISAVKSRRSKAIRAAKPRWAGFRESEYGVPSGSGPLLSYYYSDFSALS